MLKIQQELNDFAEELTLEKPQHIITEAYNYWARTDCASILFYKISHNEISEEQAAQMLQYPNLCLRLADAYAEYDAERWTVIENAITSFINVDLPLEFDA